MTEELLALRKKAKSRKPDFKRQDFQLKKLKLKWRRPKGIHSKLRLNKAGHMKKPSPGFSSPKKVRNLHPTGFKVKLINNINDLNTLEKNEAILLSSALGKKKRVNILKKAKELKKAVLNIKDIDAYISSVSEKFEKKKEKSKTTVEKTEDKKPTQKVAEKVEDKKESSKTTEKTEPKKPKSKK